MAQTTTLPAIAAGEGGLNRYLQEIRLFPMLQPEEEFMLAKRWKEHGDTAAAHKLITSHLRLVAKIAMGYRGYGLPVGEVISEGNVGLMQAVKKFEPDKGFRLATYAMWWIKASIQEFVLRSWSLVKMGTTANQKKLFFNLRKIKGQIQALEEGDLKPDQVKLIAKRLGVTEDDVVSMNRRLGGDTSLNAQIRTDSEGEWQDWLVDDSDNQEEILVQQRGSLAALVASPRSPRQAYRARTQGVRSPAFARRPGDTRRPVAAIRLCRARRIRQIEVRAFEKVQKAVKNAAQKAMLPPPRAALQPPAATAIRTIATAPRSCR